MLESLAWPTTGCGWEAAGSFEGDALNELTCIKRLVADVVKRHRGFVRMHSISEAAAAQALGVTAEVPGS